VSGYTVSHLDEIDEISDGRCPSRPVRHHFGIMSFGVNTWTGRDVGDRIINEHDESEPDSDEELYIVHSGRATFELDGDRVDAPAGTFVFALGGSPGKVYEPSGFEIWSPLNRLYAAGQYAEAADRGRELIEAHPEYAGLFYNVACCESLAGRTTDAIEHLRVAFERSERFRSFAEGDSDLDPIRDEAAFKALMRG
jgi:tetratricopeptide (TPR) repeat protein